MSSFDWFIQIIISLTGVLSIYFVNKQDDKYKYGSLFGVIGQPFWMIAMYRTEQWGVFAICFIYGYIWCKGFYEQWIKKGK